MDLRIIDDLTRRLSEILPPGLSQARDEAEDQIRAILTRTFRQMNLVTREEFEAQTAVLARTREKLEALEAELAAGQAKS